MITIKFFAVQNFKSLVAAKVVTFGTTNMVYGYNNSGKSNLFKILQLIFRRKQAGTRVKVKGEGANANGRLADSTLIKTTNFWNGSIWGEPFLFTNNDRSKPISFQVQLTISNSILPSSVELGLNGYLGADHTDVLIEGVINAVDYETSEIRLVQSALNGKQFYHNDDGIDYFFDNALGKLGSDVGEEILNKFDDLILLIDSNRNFVRETMGNSEGAFDISNFKKWLYELYIDAEKNPQFIALTNFLRSFNFSANALAKLNGSINNFPFNDSTEIGFARFDEELEIMLDNGAGKLPLKNFGSGVQQFMFLLTLIFHSKSRIVIIEELELNLSPLYQIELLVFLKSLMPSLFDQLLFSSHSPFFTQEEAGLIDIHHHVQMVRAGVGGTIIDSHDDIATTVDEVTGQSYLSLLYS